MNSRIVLLLVVQLWVAAIVPASCSGASGDRNYAISFSFPSFKGVGRRDSGFQLSWDAGIVDGALHLTADEVYVPLNQFPPDSHSSAGNVWLEKRIPLALRSREFSDGSSSQLQEASFSTSFTMSVSRVLNHSAFPYRNDGGILFEVLPEVKTGSDRAIYYPLASSISGNISVEVGKLAYYRQWEGTFGLYVSVSPASTPDATPAKYTVWVDYYAKLHNLSVYVEDSGKPKPRQATLDAPLSISDIITWTSWTSELDSYFGLFASRNRMTPSCQPVIYSWNLTADKLSFPSTVPTVGRRRRRILRFLARVLSLVLVGAAAAAIVFAAAWCLASRYRALAMKLKLSKAMRRLPGVPREFKYAAVKKATRGFHERMRLGRGGFGAVYKGAMIATSEDDDGRRRLRYVEVAVKKFTRKEDRSYDDFLAEVAVINRLRHRNIVPLIGWCYENGELLLIYQYMLNGSLDQHLFREGSNQHHPVLRWEARYNVIKDVAAGLHYVHHEYERVVLHRDIKASNIMIDAAFHGHLGDFGLARVVALDKNCFTDLGVAGTWGFIAPEYAISHKATRQTDVYAFGVLVLEVVTGRRSLSAAEDEFPLLTDWVWWLHGEGRLLEAVDGELALAAVDADDAARLLLLGLACSNPNPSHRPSMAEVVQVVGKSMAPPDVPLAKPMFVWPPEGDQLAAVSDDDPDDDDDFVQTDHRDSDRSYRVEIEGSDGLASGSIRSSDIIKRKSRNLVVETEITRDIGNCV